MKIYVAIWEDRHSDTTVHAFSDKEKAIDWAKKNARENDRFGIEGGVDQILTSGMVNDGWVYYGLYSCENDSIHVVEVTVDAELTKKKEVEDECK